MPNVDPASPSRPIVARGGNVSRWGREAFIKYFFGANAWMAIVVLGLIMLSLYSESIGFDPAGGFFGQNYRNLRIYRQAGLEFVDILKSETAEIDALAKDLAAVRLAELKRQTAAGQRAGLPASAVRAQTNAALGPFDDYNDRLSSTEDPLGAIISTLSDTVTATRDAAIDLENKKAEKQLYLRAGKKDLADKVTYSEIDLAAAVQPLHDALPSIHQANAKLASDLAALVAQPPPAANAAMRADLAGFPAQLQAARTRILALDQQAQNWNPNAPVPWYAGVVDFFFNTNWLTASSWQNYYGVVPLLAGSTLISFVALVIAVPLGVGAGIYINQVATPWEQNVIKPSIEFISAIPSVVLGFFGIEVLGQFLIQLSRWGILPPFSSRLNVLTAGILLAFMAVPTIFTLTEDAINNVPRAFKEASYALGATRLQTIWRIILPASLSGVVSAVLLGFGRVIGETMVVLLCAGNSIQIPPLSDGLMVLFQPVHTMTGIIAQELGEAERGSIEWHALFTVGLFLFLISLVINFIAQRVVKRFKISIG
jgi:phosphate transport system permease protein